MSCLHRDKDPRICKKTIEDSGRQLWGIYPWVPSWLYMGRALRGGPARKIKACTARLQGVLDIVIVPNQILYL
jgi:hypothetical protein